MGAMNPERLAEIETLSAEDGWWLPNAIDPADAIRDLLTAYKELRAELEQSQASARCANREAYYLHRQIDYGA